MWEKKEKNIMKKIAIKIVGMMVIAVVILQFNIVINYLYDMGS